MPEPLTPPPIERPDGRLYRPRKIVAEAVNDEDGDMTGVVVFGTHDTELAQPLADQYAAWQVGKGAVAVKPERVWWRDGMTHGERAWISDEVRGRAGVCFREIAESGQP